MQYISNLCVWIALAGIALGHNIQMGPHSRECFHEQLHRDDKMTVSFQVGDREFGGAGNLEVDFWVRVAFTRSLQIGHWDADLQPPVPWVEAGLLLKASALFYFHC